MSEPARAYPTAERIGTGKAAAIEPLLISQGEATRQLGISRLTLIAEIKNGRLRYVLVGSRRKFKPEDLRTYIERQGRGCEEDGALLPGGKGRPTGTRISRSTVIDFEEALKRTTANKLKSSRQKSEPMPSSAS